MSLLPLPFPATQGSWGRLVEGQHFIHGGGTIWQVYIGWLRGAASDLIVISAMCDKDVYLLPGITKVAGVKEGE